MVGCRPNLLNGPVSPQCQNGQRLVTKVPNLRFAPATSSSPNPNAFPTRLCERTNAFVRQEAGITAEAVVMRKPHLIEPRRGNPPPPHLDQYLLLSFVWWL